MAYLSSVPGPDYMPGEFNLPDNYNILQISEIHAFEEEFSGIRTIRPRRRDTRRRLRDRDQRKHSTGSPSPSQEEERRRPHISRHTGRKDSGRSVLGETLHQLAVDEEDTAKPFRNGHRDI
ncbi:MAG: hypothetical protein ABEJ93_01440 [Candidatus Nanohalobium sp.]